MIWRTILRAGGVATLSHCFSGSSSSTKPGRISWNLVLFAAFPGSTPRLLPTLLSRSFPFQAHQHDLCVPVFLLFSAY
jgi:hypothetical protein